MAIDPVVIGDAASQARNIGPSDYAIGWQVTGPAGEAVALDSWQAVFEDRMRAVLTAIIQADAPTGLTLQDLTIQAPITLQLAFDVGGHAAVLSLDLSTLYPTTGEPSPIGPTGQLGAADGLTHPDHAHRLPSRASGETPVVGLDQLANAPGPGLGMRLGFDATTGEPEYVPEITGAVIGTAAPEDVAATAATGTAATVPPIDHVHALADRVVTLMKIAAATDAADYGKAIGYDAVTGLPTVIDPGGGTFLSQSDTPAAFGSIGTAATVNAAQDALEFTGPYEPLIAPAPPTNLRATDAFDMALEMHWDAAAFGAAAYEWQRKTPAAAWPTGAGTQTTGLNVRGIALSASSYDFRVRSVGTGGHLQSAWVELLAIPVILTPTPAASTTHSLTRVQSGTLRFTWDNLDVTNGGVGAARVVKTARYEYQYRVGGAATWGTPQDVSGRTFDDILGLANGTEYEAAARAHVRRSDATMTDVTGPWSGPSNREKPVKDTVTLTYGMAATRTGAILSPRSVELTPATGLVIEITNPSNPAAAGQFYALDIARGAEYDHNYNVAALETRPLPSDITQGGSYQAEAEPVTGPRRYSVGPAIDISAIQRWLIEVS